MEINDDAKEIVQEVGEAINAAVERSTEVAAAIGLRWNSLSDSSAAVLELTDEDRRTLRNMKISIDDAG